MFTNIRRWPQTFGYPGFKHKGTEQDSYRDMFTSMLGTRMPDYHSITIITILFGHMQIPLNMFIFTASFRILRPRMARGPRTAVDRHGHCRSSLHPHISPSTPNEPPLKCSQRGERHCGETSTHPQPQIGASGKPGNNTRIIVLVLMNSSQYVQHRNHHSKGKLRLPFPESHPPIRSKMTMRPQGPSAAWNEYSTQTSHTLSSGGTTHLLPR